MTVDSLPAHVCGTCGAHKAARTPRPRLGNGNGNGKASSTGSAFGHKRARAGQLHNRSTIRERFLRCQVVSESEAAEILRDVVAEFGSGPYLWKGATVLIRRGGGRYYLKEKATNKTPINLDET